MTLNQNEANKKGVIKLTGNVGEFLKKKIDGLVKVSLRLADVVVATQQYDC